MHHGIDDEKGIERAVIGLSNVCETASAPPFVAHFVRATSPVNGGRGMPRAVLLPRPAGEVPSDEVARRRGEPTQSGGGLLQNRKFVL